MNGYVVVLSCGHSYIVYPVMGKLTWLPRKNDHKKCNLCPGRPKRVVVAVDRPNA